MLKDYKIIAIGLLTCLIGIVLMNEPRTSPHFTIGFVVFGIAVIITLVGILMPSNKK